VSIDANRNAIADIFLTEVTEGADGNLLNKMIKVTPQVNQTLGIPEADFRALGAVSRENPSCE
jgi:branched-chain amino acid transport system substrate-binding protein